MSNLETLIERYQDSLQTVIDDVRTLFNEVYSAEFVAALEQNFQHYAEIPEQIYVDFKDFFPTSARRLQFFIQMLPQFDALFAQMSPASLRILSDLNSMQEELDLFYTLTKINYKRLSRHIKDSIAFETRADAVKAMTPSVISYHNAYDVAATRLLQMCGGDVTKLDLQDTFVSEAMNKFFGGSPIILRKRLARLVEVYGGVLELQEQQEPQKIDKSDLIAKYGPKISALDRILVADNVNDYAWEYSLRWIPIYDLRARLTQVAGVPYVTQRGVLQTKLEERVKEMESQFEIVLPKYESLGVVNCNNDDSNNTDFGPLAAAAFTRLSSLFIKNPKADEVTIAHSCTKYDFNRREAIEYLAQTAMEKGLLPKILLDEKATEIMRGELSKESIIAELKQGRPILLTSNCGVEGCCLPECGHGMLGIIKGYNMLLSEFTMEYICITSPMRITIGAGSNPRLISVSFNQFDTNVKGRGYTALSIGLKDARQGLDEIAKFISEERQNIVYERIRQICGDTHASAS